MAVDFFAGCVGGGAGILVGHPMDTVKVRIQTQCPINPKYRGTYHCLTSIIRQESIAGLYKGIASPLYGVTAVNAMIFGVYGMLKPMVTGAPGYDAIWAHFLAGSVSGAVQSVIASPMELVKTRMQLDESVKSKGNTAWVVLKNVYLKEGGIRRGVFKGWCVTLAREIPGLGSYFATYEALTRTGREVTTLEMMFAGGMAGIASWVSCFPMDVIKTRLQSDVQGKYKGAIDCFQKTISGEGYKALFRGLNSTLLRAFPSNAATLTTVTWIMRWAEQSQAEGTTNNLEALLEQWDERRVQVQEKIASSLQLQIPQYSLLHSTATTGPMEVYKQFFYEYQNIFQNAKNSYSNTNSNSNSTSTLLFHTCSGNASDYTSASGLRLGIDDNGNLSSSSSLTNSVRAELENNSRIINPSTTPALVSVSASESTSVMVTDEVSNLQSCIAETAGRGAVEVAVNIIQKTTTNTTDEDRDRSSSPIHGKSSTPNSISKSNSHDTGSFPPDLGVLAEILDLPLIVLQNSLAGKPITLFNIILTWLREGTCFSFCKCLDALDHCVCVNC